MHKTFSQSGYTQHHFSFYKRQAFFKPTPFCGNLNYQFSTKSGAGYIALTSVIIMSLLLITIALALSSANYFSRFNILENEFKEHSNNLAEACVNYALGQLALDINYAGHDQAVLIGADTCAVVSVLPAGAVWPKIITAQAVYPKNQAERSFTNLTVTINANLSVISWQETAD